MSAFLEQLAGGDRRSIGASGVVVQQVLADPSKLVEIIAGLSTADPVVRMRCADVAEKVSVTHPEWLQPHKKVLIKLAARATQHELSWHLAQMLPRLTLSAVEHHVALRIMFSYLNDPSKIVKTFAMQALADFAQNDRVLRRRLPKILAAVLQSGSPAMQARARRLLASPGGF